MARAGNRWPASWRNASSSASGSASRSLLLARRRAGRWRRKGSPSAPSSAWTWGAAGPPGSTRVRLFSSRRRRGAAPGPALPRRRPLLGQLLQARPDVRLEALCSLVPGDRAQHLAQALETLLGIARLAVGLLRILVLGREIGRHGPSPSVVQRSGSRRGTAAPGSAGTSTKACPEVRWQPLHVSAARA